MKDTFISSEGTIGRAAFIVRFVALLLFTVVVTMIAMEFFAHWHHGTFYTLGIFVGIIVGMICYMIVLMQVLKRLRDMGKEAFWSILMLIPGVNLLFLLYTAVAPSK